MKYQKITQKPYCCVGACLEMVLRRRGITDYNQEQIASELGLIVPVDYKDRLPLARVGEMPAAGYGTQIQEEQYSINHFFKENRLDLRETYHYITDIKEARTLLSNNSSQDILIIFHCGTLYDNPEADWGPMVLFDPLDGGQVAIQENSPKRGLETIDLAKLLHAIEVHGRNNGAGFYLVS